MLFTVGVKSNTGQEIYSQRENIVQLNDYSLKQDWIHNMSFVSFKRQLSADLERMSSANHGNRNLSYPKSASTFRKLGSTLKNRNKPVRKIKEIKNRSPILECVPVAPPPSRLELFPPFIETRSDWTTENDEILRGNVVENCPKHYLPNYKLFSQVLPNISVEKCHKINHLNSDCHSDEFQTRSQRKHLSAYRNTVIKDLWEPLPCHENSFSPVCSSAIGDSGIYVPGRENTPDLSYCRTSTVCCKTLSFGESLWKFGKKFEIADQRKKSMARLIVRLPKTENAKPAVTFSYKHGRRLFSNQPIQFN